MSITDIKKMPFAKRLQLMEQIWDTLRDESEHIDSPDWHEGVLQKRKEDFEKGQVKHYSIEEVRQKLG